MTVSDRAAPHVASHVASFSVGVVVGAIGTAGAGLGVGAGLDIGAAVGTAVAGAAVGAVGAAGMGPDVRFRPLSTSAGVLTSIAAMAFAAFHFGVLPPAEKTAPAPQDQATAQVVQHPVRNAEITVPAARVPNPA